MPGRIATSARTHPVPVRPGARRTALVSALLARRPAAVTRLRTLVAAGNRASLALLARAGRVSSGLPERGVLDVTVELPAATRARSTVEKVAGFWAQGARKLIDQTYMFPQLPQAGLIPAVERYFENGRDEPRPHRHVGAGGERAV